MQENNKKRGNSGNRKEQGDKAYDKTQEWRNMLVWGER